MATNKATGKVEKETQISQRTDKLKQVKNTINNTKLKVKSILGKVNLKLTIPKINPKVFLYSSILAGLLGTGGLVYYNLDEIKEKAGEVMKKVEKEKPIYSIDENNKVNGIPQNNGTILVMYELKNGEKVIVNRKFSTYFLDCDIYNIITPKGEEKIVYVSKDKFNIEDLPQDYIISGIKVKTITKIKPGEEKLDKKNIFFKNNNGK